MMMMMTTTTRITCRSRLSLSAAARLRSRAEMRSTSWPRSQSAAAFIVSCCTVIALWALVRRPSSWRRPTHAVSPAECSTPHGRYLVGFLVNLRDDRRWTRAHLFQLNPIQPTNFPSQPRLTHPRTSSTLIQPSPCLLTQHTEWVCFTFVNNLIKYWPLQCQQKICH